VSRGLAALLILALAASALAEPAQESACDSPGAALRAFATQLWPGFGDLDHF